jgi:hypothetical protein
MIGVAFAEDIPTLADPPIPGVASRSGEHGVSVIRDEINQRRRELVSGSFILRTA